MYRIRGKISNIEDQDINTDKGDFVKKLVTIEEYDTGFVTLCSLKCLVSQQLM